MASATSDVLSMDAGLAAAVPAAAVSSTASAASGSPELNSPPPPSFAASAGATSSASYAAAGTVPVQGGAAAVACAHPSPRPALPLSPPDAAGSFLPSSALYIAPSTLPDAGCGLFTRTALPAETWICEYIGTHLSLRQVMQRSDRSYIICTGSLNSHIDAAEHTHVLARYINDNACCLLNACFVKYPRDKRVLVRSTRTIVAGSEIFASYGQGYWRAKEKNGTRMRTSFAGSVVSPPTAIADSWKPPHHSAVEPLPSEDTGKLIDQRQPEEQVKQQEAERLDAALLQAEQRRA